MRKSWLQVWNGEKYVLVPREEAHLHRVEKGRSPYIFGDIKPFRSPVDGTMVTSRKHLREHNIRNGCIDIGNEQVKPKQYEPSSAKEDIQRAIYQLGDK